MEFWILAGISTALEITLGLLIYAQSVSIKFHQERYLEVVQYMTNLTESFNELKEIYEKEVYKHEETTNILQEALNELNAIEESIDNNEYYSQLRQN